MGLFRIAACCALALLLVGPADAQRGRASPPFEAHLDIGGPARPGAIACDPAGGLRVTGGGANIWGTRDSFHFVWTRRSGDLHLAADIALDPADPGSDPHRKAGLMLRADLNPGAPYADLMLHGDGTIALQWREMRDGPTRQLIANLSGRRRLRLEREGSYVYFSVAGEDGVLRHAGGNVRIELPATYYAGLAVSAHDDARTETATFSNLSLDLPVLTEVPDTGYPARVESTLEVMEVSGTENRRIVRHFDGKIEAPNWSRDGRFLLYNGNGRIWRIPAAGGEPEAVNTGPNIRNNNDHGLSPDGTQLIISDQSRPDNLSRIHILPVAGSDAPRLVVGRDDARSYWHGWSPDGRTIAYVHVSLDNRAYDIWARDLDGGLERPLIAAPGVDDGPEYSPDGRHLWFNSTRSGAMQIWRADAMARTRGRSRPTPPTATGSRTSRRTGTGSCSFPSASTST